MMKKPQLFLLHFAGGNSFSYRTMEQFLNDFDVVPLELPGRGRRTTESLLTDYDEATYDLYKQVNKRLNTLDFALYGHSMGAYLSLSLAGLLERDGKNVTCLIVSGSPGPGVGLNKRRYMLDDEAFVDEIKKMGGMPDDFFTSKELIDFFLPILRADFEISEEHKIPQPVKTPIFAIMGSAEEKKKEITHWAGFTLNTFTYEILEGNHFFIHKWPDLIAQRIKEQFTKALFNHRSK